MAVETFDLSGHKISSDSFDSGDPNYSTNGRYDPTLGKTKDNGHICVVGSVIDTLAVGTLKVRGHVRMGPGTNTLTIGTYGSVGDLDWVSTQTGIKEGHWTRDFNVSFPTVAAPPGPWLPVAPVHTKVDGTIYQYVFNMAGDWYPSSPITGNVLVNAPDGALVRIGVPFSVNLISQEVLRIADTGARVEFYVTAPVFSLGGQAHIDNRTEKASRFRLFGLSTCTNIFLSGNAPFYGVIYAPNAELGLGGGGNDIWDFVGSSLTRKVWMNGHYNFHFDEDLLRSPGLPWIIGQPPTQTRKVGEPVVFTALAWGADLGYQWQFEGSEIAGATNSSFTIPSARTTDAGTYSVVVTNAFGAVTSSNAFLTVNPSSLRLGIVPASRLIFRNLSVGTNYQLQVCHSDTWTNRGSPILADASDYSQYVESPISGSLYRLVAMPVPRSAAATAIISNGSVVAATITDPGSGYASVPAVQVVGGGGTGAQAIAEVSSGSITDIMILNGGSGYTDLPTVSIEPPPVAPITPETSEAFRLDYTGLIPALTYQLQTSMALVDWTNHGDFFTATNVTHSRHVDFQTGTRFFRLLQP